MQIPGYLPTFRLGTEVAAIDGKQDKIEIHLSGFSALCANDDEAHSILHHLGPSQVIYRGERRTNSHESHSAAFGWIFKTPVRGNEFRRQTIEIRKARLSFQNQTGDAESMPPPLFSGNCDWQIYRSIQGCELIGQLCLYVNPTRFLRYQSANTTLPHGLLKNPELSLPPYGELSLDGADNWLPLSGRLLNRVSGARWDEHLSRYLRKIDEALVSEFERACSVQQITHSEIIRYNVKYVETYWEWITPSPSTMVRDLGPFVASFSARRRIQNTSELEGNMLLFRAETAPGEWLKVYAKTNRRIRIEITHRLTGRGHYQFPSTTAEDGIVSRAGGHTFNSRSGVLNFLSRLREEAAKVVNRFLRHVERQAQSPASGITATMAVTDVLRAVPDRTLAETFLDLLINQGSLARLTEWPESAKEAVNSLTTAGIIVRGANRRSYVLAPLYYHAFRMLREHGSLPMLVVRRRTRPPRV